MKSTKKSLLLSTISLVLCFAMLLGTTWAWFTDEVTSGTNKIVAGNLDIEVSYKDDNDWVSIEGKDSLFDKNALWEPGHTEYVTLKVENKGTLALKYQMSVSPVTETSGTNVAGDPFKLSDYLVFATTTASTDEPTYADRDAARTAAGAEMKLNQAALSQPSTLLAKAAEATENPAEYITLVIYMPETVGNEANYRGTTVPQIDLGITVTATQLTSESDSFGPDYDIETPWMGSTAEVPAEVEGKIHIESAEQLAGLAAAVNAGDDYNNKTIVLDKNIDLNNVEWIQINGAGHNITLDGNNKTIKNLKVSSGHNAGLFATGSGCTIKNLTVDGATVKGVGRIAVICGHGMCVTVDKCTVKNATVTAVVTNNDDGDKAGAIVGYLSGEPNAKVTNCTVENCTITGYRDIGGLVGYAGGTYTVTDNTVKNCIVINDKTNNYKNYNSNDEFDVKDIIGEAGASGTESNNTSTNVKVVAGESVSAAVKNAISEAAEGATILLPTTDAAIELPTTMNKGITIKGNGENTKVTTNKTSVSANGTEISDMTINGSGSVGNAGELNISGDNTTLKNVTFIGEGRGESGNRKLAVTVSTHGENGVVFDNVHITNAFRGIQFWNLSGNSVIRNSVLDINGYTFNVDAVSSNATLTVENTTLNGWTSYTSGIKLVSFKDCKFGENNYKILKAYSATEIENCEFCDGFQFSSAGTSGFNWTFKNCTVGGVKLTADNFASFIDKDEGWNNAVTVTIDGVSVAIS